MKICCFRFLTWWYLAKLSSFVSRVILYTRARFFRNIFLSNFLIDLCFLFLKIPVLYISGYYNIICCLHYCPIVSGEYRTRLVLSWDIMSDGSFWLLLAGVGRKVYFCTTGSREPVQNFIQANFFFIQAKLGLGTCVTPSTKIKYKIIEKVK